MSNGSRPWSTVHQDALVEIVKMNGENELQRLQPAVTDQIFIISQFYLIFESFSKQAYLPTIFFVSFSDLGNVSYIYTVQPFQYQQIL